MLWGALSTKVVGGALLFWISMTNDDLHKFIVRDAVSIPQYPPSPVIVVDSREQKPFKFSVPTVKKGLASGDYSVVGYEDDITVERKSLPDLVRCCGRERSRFMDQCKRLIQIKCRLLIIEGSWSDIEAGKGIHPKSHVTPAQITGTLLALSGMGLPWITADNRKVATEITQRYLLGCHKREWDYLRKKLLGH